MSAGSNVHIRVSGASGRCDARRSALVARGSGFRDDGFGVRGSRDASCRDTSVDASRSSDSATDGVHGPNVIESQVDTRDHGDHFPIHDRAGLLLRRRGRR